MTTKSNDDQVADDAPQAPSINIFAILVRRWPYLVLGLLVGAAVGLLIHTSAVPQYQSAAQVLVIKKRTELIKEGDMRIGSVEDYVATQVTLIKSEKIRLAAAEKARSMTFANPLPPDNISLAGMIGAGLLISRDKDATIGGPSVGSGVLNLSMNGGHPEDCRKLLEAVILAHQSELYSIYDKATTDKIATLDKLTDAIKEQRRKDGEAKIRQLAELRTITTEEVPNIRLRVSSNRTEANKIKSELIDLKDQLELIAKTGPNEQDRLLTLAQLTAQLRPNSGSLPTGEGMRPTSLIRELEMQRRDLLQKVGLGKDHPKVLALETQITEIKTELERQATSKEPNDPANTKSPTLDELGAFAKWAEQKQKTLDRKLAQIVEQLQADEQTLKSVGGLQDNIDDLTTKTKQHDDEIKRLDAEKLTTTATQGAGGYSLEQITPAANGRKIAPVFFRSMSQGIMVGLLFGAALMWLAETNDKSFRSPAEIRQRLGVPVIGHIPVLDKSTVTPVQEPYTLDETLITAHKPKSTYSETYRGLRTQIFFSTQGRGHQVIQVTSPTPGDGKSTTAANLAIAIAQSNKRTLLVDCDFRKPRVHKLFNITNEKGLAGVIAGTDQLEEGICPSGVANLDILPCGVRPANPAELLSSPQFQDILKSLREKYDFVIVDTPPVLAVTDPVIVAPRVDGVIIVFRMSKKVRPTAEWARESLAGVGAQLIGVVINAAEVRQRGYGYGGYGYSYGYNYGYNYNYQYADSYTDDTDAVKA